VTGPGAGGAVVIHGLTGSPQSVTGLGAALEAAGFTVEVPLLPGHGTSVEDLTGYGWVDWEAAAADSFDRVVGRCPGRPVVVAGLSMGGALAADLAAGRPEVAALVAVNPLVDPPAGAFKSLLGELLAAGERFLPGVAGDLADPDADEEAYDRIPVAALLSMCEGLDGLASRLASIRCPVLILTSRHDHVVPIVSSDVLAGAVAGPVERVWLERSSHVATLDLEHEELERRAVAFALRAITAAPLLGRPGTAPRR
jgi:carboxylesterase